MGTFDHLAVYRRAHERAELTTRMYSAVPLAEWQRLGVRKANGDEQDEDRQRHSGLRPVRR